MFGEDVAAAMAGEAPANVTIPRERFEDLIEKEAWLQALNAAGVKTWDRIEFANEIFDKFNKS